ncbi:MAG: hypothetical protein AAF127_06805 [Pseudomonadota bacterium]
MRKIATCIGVAAVSLLSSPAAAQFLNPTIDTGRADTQVVGAVTIPLGTAKDTRRTAPRLEIITRRQAGTPFQSIIARDAERRWREQRIGVTLDRDMTLMFNGQPAAATEKKQGVSTLGAVGIGVGVLALVGGIVLITDFNDALDDLSDPD